MNKKLVNCYNHRLFYSVCGIQYNKTANEARKYRNNKQPSASSKLLNYNNQPTYSIQHVAYSATIAAQIEPLGITNSLGIEKWINKLELYFSTLTYN